MTTLPRLGPPRAGLRTPLPGATAPVAPVSQRHVTLRSTRGQAAVAALWGKSAFRRLTAALLAGTCLTAATIGAARADSGVSDGTDNRALNVGVRFSW